MQGDTIFTREQAVELQQQAQQDGRLAIWTISWNPKDYPGKAAARPHLLGEGGTHSIIMGVLLADSPDELREMLPEDLSKMPRNPMDDPVIVEVWM